MELVYDPRPPTGSRRSPRSTAIADGRAGQGPGVTSSQVHRKAPPWDGKWWGTQPAPRQAAGQDDRLGGDAAGARRRSAAASTTRPSPVRLAAVEAVRRDRRPGDARRSSGSGSAARPTPTSAGDRPALGTMGDKEALPLLIAALRDAEDARAGPRRRARRASRRSVGEGGPGLLELLEPRTDLSATGSPG